MSRKGQPRLAGVLPIDRFLTKLEPLPNGCWRWIGQRNVRTDYGVFYFEGRQQYAHRVSYLLFVGVIPAGLELDHLCRNVWCVKPSHLEAVTRGENARRAVPFLADRRWGYCAQGHPMEGANVYVHAKTGNRRCKLCAHERTRKYRAAKKRGVA